MSRYSTHWVPWDMSFDTCFLYGESRVVSLLIHNTSFTVKGGNTCRGVCLLDFLEFFFNE